MSMASSLARKVRSFFRYDVSAFQYGRPRQVKQTCPRQVCPRQMCPQQVVVSLVEESVARRYGRIDQVSMTDLRNSRACLCSALLLCS